MQVLNTQPTVLSNTHFQTSGFSIKANAVAFQTIFKGIYSNPIAAMLREIGCNCIDAYGSAATERPWDFHAPTIVEPWCSWRDYATGISPELMSSLYTELFESSKRNDADLIGGLGIGRMSPLAYSPTFEVISIQNSEKNHYMVTLDGGAPTLIHLSKMVTTESTGLEVKVPIQIKDVELIKSEAVKVYQYFTFRPKSNIELPTLEPTLQGKGWHFTGARESGVVSGGVFYRITDTRPFPDQIRNLIAGGVRVELPIGSFSFDAGRENVVLDDQTKQEIIKACAGIVEEFAEVLTAGLSGKTEYEASVLLAKRIVALPDSIRASFNISTVLKRPANVLPGLRYQAQYRRDPIILCDCGSLDPSTNVYQISTGSKRPLLVKGTVRFDYSIVIIDIPDTSLEVLNTTLFSGVYVLRYAGSQTAKNIAAWLREVKGSLYEYFGHYPDIKLLSETGIVYNKPVQAPRLSNVNVYDNGVKTAFKLADYPNGAVLIKTFNSQYDDDPQYKACYHRIQYLTKLPVLGVPKTHYDAIQKLPKMQTLSGFISSLPQPVKYVRQEILSKFHTYQASEKLIAKSKFLDDYLAVCKLPFPKISQDSAKLLEECVKLEVYEPVLQIPQDQYETLYELAPTSFTKPQVRRGDYHAAMEQYYLKG